MTTEERGKLRKLLDSIDGRRVMNFTVRTVEALLADAELAAEWEAVARVLAERVRDVDCDHALPVDKQEAIAELITWAQQQVAAAEGSRKERELNE